MIKGELKMNISKSNKNKPFYKKTWFWGIVIVLIVVGAMQDKATTETNQVENKNTLAEDNTKNSETTQAIASEIEPPKETPKTAEQATTEKSEVEPDKDLMVISDLFEVIKKDEKTVDEWLGSPSSSEEGKFKIYGTETKVPSVTSIYKDKNYEVIFIEGKAQRITYTASVA